MIESEKENKKIPNKDKSGGNWFYSTVTILRGKSSVIYNAYGQNMGISLYSKYKNNKFSIGYMIKPSLHVNKVFIEQVEKYLRATFHKNTMKNTIYVIIKKGICVIALIMFYES